MRDAIDFMSMDLGSAKPTTAPMQTIEVVIDCEGMVGDYAKAFCAEAYRVNPRTAEQVELTQSELLDYLNYLLTKRVQFVQDTCSDFRKLKPLYVPSYFQFVMSTIGVVIDRDRGLKLVPVMDKPSKMTLAKAMQISEKIGSFEYDLQIVRDAMPRAIDGHPDVMSSALIAGYVRSYRKVEHPAATYVTAFVNMKLRKEQALAALYTIQYDDLEFIRMALTTQKGLY